MTEANSASMAARKAVQILGGPVATARLLKVKGDRHQTVQSWLKNRVPAEYCPDIERETDKLGQRVPCEELRPDIAWSVLRQQATTQQEVQRAA